MTRKTYSELISLPTFEERYFYLKLNGQVGESTFGSHRYLNQAFYSSSEWKRVRDFVLIRDKGCDLAIPGREIHDRFIIHHINPITINDIYNNANCILDPENLICTVKNTHDAIHYGDKSLLISEPVIRAPNDMAPWKKRKKYYWRLNT